MTDVYDVNVAAQSPAELRLMLRLYAQAKPTRVLEIGTLYGGTLRAWLVNAQPAATVVAIDPNHLNAAEYEEWVPDGVQLVVGRGRSQDDAMVRLAEEHAPYDWVFVDGDHSYEAVSFDAQLALRLASPGCHVLFHDVVPPPGGGETPPGRVVEALADSYEVWQYSAPRPPGYPEESASGIGVVKV